LALFSVQCGATVPSAPLPTLSPSLTPPCAPTTINDMDVTVQAYVAISAGENCTLVHENTAVLLI